MQRGISVREAQQIVLEHAGRLGGEVLPLREAQGRILAEAIVAGRTLPPADNSAMDGYALRAGDLKSATARTPVVLPVVFEVPAGGEAQRALEAGEAARIFTGAPIPRGADTVVPQEEVEAGDQRVSFFSSPPVGKHVRRAGEDIRAGEVILEVGCRLGPGQLGLAASTGRTTVQVVQAPRVALLSSGDELIEPDGDPSGGRIVSSNSYSLHALCRELGVDPTYLGIARDTPESVEARLRAGFGSNILIANAGVSVGEHDHVRPVLEKMGCELLFWGVRMKPGFPVAFGRFPAGQGPLVFGLPGNPVSAMVGFEQFVRPAIRAMMGHRACFRRRVEVRAAQRFEKKAGRLHFVRVLLEEREGVWWAKSTGTQSSGVLKSMALAQGLLVFPEAVEVIEEGASVQVQVLDEQLFMNQSHPVEA